MADDHTAMPLISNHTQDSVGGPFGTPCFCLASKAHQQFRYIPGGITSYKQVIAKFDSFRFLLIEHNFFQSYPNKLGVRNIPLEKRCSIDIFMTSLLVLDSSCAPIARTPSIISLV